MNQIETLMVDKGLERPVTVQWVKECFQKFNHQLVLLQVRSLSKGIQSYKIKKKSMAGGDITYL